MFLFLVAFVIVVYVYKRSLLYSGIESSIQSFAPDSTIVGIIQTHTNKNSEKMYKALYKTTEGKCYKASFERHSYSLIETMESPCR
ncbi:hypothetical protein CN378_00135 [Bacillus sp. AFS015802]|nr:hypothetical protein CN378_00135 [Bacillus sp. AFS015802]